MLDEKWVFSIEDKQLTELRFAQRRGLEYISLSSEEVKSYYSQINNNKVAVVEDGILTYIDSPQLPLTTQNINIAIYRKKLYITKSDPLYMEYQYAIASEQPTAEIETAKNTWLAKVRQIKDQNPFMER